MGLSDEHYSLIEYISLLMEEKKINNIRYSSDFNEFTDLLNTEQSNLLQSVLAGNLKQTFINALNKEEQQQQDKKREAIQKAYKVGQKAKQQQTNYEKEQNKFDEQEANERKKQQQTNYEKEQNKFDEKYKEEVFRIFQITEKEWEQQRKHHGQIRFRYKKKFKTIFKEMSEEQNNKYEKFKDKWDKLYNNMFDKSVTWKLFPGTTKLTKYWNDFFEQFENYWKTIRHELNNIRIDYYLVPKGIHKEIDIPTFIGLEKYARKYWKGAESDQRDYYNELRYIDIERRKERRKERQQKKKHKQKQENKDQRNNKRRKERQQNKTYPKQSSPFIPTDELTADNIDSFDQYEAYKILGLKEKTSIDKRGIKKIWLILLGKFNPQQVRNAQKTDVEKKYLSEITAKINNAKDILTNEKDKFDRWVTDGRRGPFKFKQEKICFRF